MLMTTLDFYNEIEIIECPYTFCSLKHKIQEIYNLSDNQIDNSLISYIDKNNKIHYIFNETQYDKVIPIIESIIIKIELCGEETFLTLAPSLYNEYDEQKSCLNYDKVKEKNWNNKNKIHYGIKCNLCDSENIAGIRYLCGICPNFNLCQKCEEKSGRTHGHSLLKIRNPNLAPISFKLKLFAK